jgi:hypothetical protein
VNRVAWINRRSGVAHTTPDCRALAGVPARALRTEALDARRARRRCPFCWNPRGLGGFGALPS